MKIKKLVVKGLYRSFNYEIPLENEINIIHGVNGKGKTTILTILKDIFNGNFKSFYQLSFQNICIFFENDQYFKLYRQIINKKSKILFDYYIGGDLFEKKDINNTNSIKAFLKRVNTNPLFLPTKRLDYDEKYHISSQYSSRFNHDRFVYQRNLYEHDFNRYVNDNLVVRVSDIKQDLVERGRRHSMFVNRILSNLDDKLFENFFKSILLKEMDSSIQDINKEQSLEKISLLKDFKENFYSKYKHISSRNSNQVLRQIESYITEIKEPSREINVFLNLYIDNIKNKEQQISKLITPFINFETIINKLYENKKIKVTLDAKLDDMFKVVNDENDDLQVEHLSSGEKNLLIIFYNFLFKVKDQTLFMIDEPELSLHIDWQYHIIDYLKKYSQGSQTIVVTHSPDILQNHREYEIDLDKCKV